MLATQHPHCLIRTMQTNTTKTLARTPRAVQIAAGAALAGAATAAWVEYQARRAQKSHPPCGRQIEIDGTRLHCIERGDGPPVVLIHGNTVSLLDFMASGLVDRLALDHRVVAFDRPGFGYSDRPRDRLWTPAAQGQLLLRALSALNVDRATIVGHSLGTCVALAMALDAPERVDKLVLLGGYYYPSARVDALLTAPVALPVLGDVLRYTVTAVSARLMLDRVTRAMFAPQEVPGHFLPMLSREMLVRPLQLRANAEDAAFMIGQAKANSARHCELRMPVAILAGDHDKVIDFEAHSERLHGDLPGSTLTVVHGAGHMVHHAAPDEIVAAVDRFELPQAAPVPHAA
jgi:pimeloyl-ACP methyl ester carboxylesterase